jgi:hypothetical protein
MVYNKVTIWFKENPNAKEFDASVYSNDYNKVTLTVSGDYLILSLHGDDNVKTEIHHLNTIKNWITYLN